MKVLRSERTPEGLTRLVVRDGKTGDVFTLTDLPNADRTRGLSAVVPPKPADPPAPPPSPAPSYSAILTGPDSVPAAAAPVRQPVPAGPHATAATAPPRPIGPRTKTTVQPVSLAPVETLPPSGPVSVPTLYPRYGTEPPEVRMRREIAPWVAELSTAVRPSVRMDAATALAEGRYGWRDEVKTFLVKAAASDPAAVVRAHCISLLATLGYAEPEYRAFLATCAGDKNPDVRVAASIALARLEPR